MGETYQSVEAERDKLAAQVERLNHKRVIETQRDIEKSQQYRAAIKKIGAALSEAVEYQRSKLYRMDPNRDEMTPDGRTPKWFVDAVEALKATEFEAGAND